LSIPTTTSSSGNKTGHRLAVISNIISKFSNFGALSGSRCAPIPFFGTHLNERYDKDRHAKRKTYQVKRVHHGQSEEEITRA
jgi:hypothetical protein